MKSTSSRSVKATPKTEDVPDINGTRPTEETSETISTGFTEWTVLLTDGRTQMVRVPGSHGRISYGRNPRGGAEVRFYRDSTTKTYDAVLPNVDAVWSDQVMVGEPIKTIELVEAEKSMKESIKKYEIGRVEKIAEAIIKREYTKEMAEEGEAPW